MTGPVMLRITLRGLWTYRVRQVGALVAILLGVAFLSGTLALGDTLKAAVNSSFSTAYANTDVVVRSATSTTNSPDRVRGQIDGSVVATVRAVPGVAAADGVLEGTGVIVGADGKGYTGRGSNVVSTWIADAALNPWHLVAGTAPRTAGQIVIDQNTATKADLAVGRSTAVDVPNPVPVTVVGIADFGSQTSDSGNTYAAFTLAGAERYLANGADRVTSVVVRASPGVTQTQLASRVGAVLPRGEQAITGSQLVSESDSATGDAFLNSFQTFLDVFSGIALFVAVLSIHNTFSIGAAQRARDHALLRAIGATRRQVTAGLAFEAALLGLLGSVAGLVCGYGIAAGLKGAVAGFGVPLPSQRLVFTAGTAVLSLVVGVAVTLIAAVLPARRGGRTAPIEALRDVAVNRSAPSRRRTATGLALTAVGVLVTILATRAGSEGLAGVGAVAAVAGVLASGPLVVGLVTWVLNRWFRGTTRRLAQRNAARDPRRTAGAATALVIGVTMVTLFTVFAASIKTSISNSIGRTLTGDVVVSTSGSDGFSPRLAEQTAALPGVAAAVGMGSGTVDVAGASTAVGVADPAELPRVFALHLTAGSLGTDSLAVSSSKATSQKWHVGQAVRVTFADGATLDVPVGAIYADTFAIGDYVLPSALYDAHTAQPLDQNVYVRFAPGANRAAVTAAVTSVAGGYASITVQSKADYIGSINKVISTLLDITYVMLALAILIALLGVTNTIALSIHERVREIGLIRAVGATGRQVRAMVRWESLVTTLIGALTGMALGAYLGWALIASSNSNSLATFSAPPAQLVTIGVVAAVAGLLAGARPARRASRINVLRAIGSA